MKGPRSKVMTWNLSHCKACVSECTRTCSAPQGISDPEIHVIEFKGNLYQYHEPNGLEFKPVISKHVGGRFCILLKTPILSPFFLYTCIQQLMKYFIIHKFFLLKY